MKHLFSVLSICILRIQRSLRFCTDFSVSTDLQVLIRVADLNLKSWSIVIINFHHSPTYDSYVLSVIWDKRTKTFLLFVAILINNRACFYIIERTSEQLIFIFSLLFFTWLDHNFICIREFLTRVTKYFFYLIYLFDQFEVCVNQFKFEVCVIQVLKHIFKMWLKLTDLFIKNLKLR